MSNSYSNPNTVVIVEEDHVGKTVQELLEEAACMPPEANSFSIIMWYENDEGKPASAESFLEDVLDDEDVAIQVVTQPHFLGQFYETEEKKTESA